MGAFGKVHLGLNTESGELMAVKEVSINKGGSGGERGLRVERHVDILIEEVELLRKLRHNNIVRYLVGGGVGRGLVGFVVFEEVLGLYV